jgi:Na+-driven multidrug efflux pump
MGQNLGARKYERIAEALRLFSRFCLASGLVIALVLGLLAPLLMRQFADHPEVIGVGVLYLWIVPITFGLAGMVMVINASFNGLGRPLPGVAVSVTRMIVLYVPLAYLFSIWWGVPGMFAGAALANAISGAMAWIWFRRICRRHPKPGQTEIPGGTMETIS